MNRNNKQIFKDDVKPNKTEVTEVQKKELKKLAKNTRVFIMAAFLCVLFLIVTVCIGIINADKGFGIEQINTFVCLGVCIIFGIVAAIMKNKVGKDAVKTFPSSAKNILKGQFLLPIIGAFVLLKEIKEKETTL
ncbi:MAG TPA: hypothetical protein GXX71_00370 [Acholeplasma sp.]|jgi:Mn2+/Fe2+ NRAMP family transporter|nr:hypothetical protein [Acholeplasma sp.]